MSRIFHRGVTLTVILFALMFSSFSIAKTLKNSDRYRFQGDQSRYQFRSGKGSTKASGSSSHRPVRAKTGRISGVRTTKPPKASATYVNTLATFQETLLPYEVRDRLARAGIPLSAIGIYVQEISGAHNNLLSLNADAPMNPASTMKLVTTYAALEIMGDQHQWTTTVYRDGPVVDGVLQGNLIFKGTGDPKITAENFQTILKKLQEAGIKRIAGDLILDRSQFDVPSSSRSFDGQATRTYNVDADALMLSFKTVLVKLAADPISQSVNVTLLPHPKQIELINEVAYDRVCGDWGKKIRSRLTPKPDGGYQMVVSGRFSSECGEQSLKPVAILNGQDFFGGVFETEWGSLGGAFDGRVRDGLVTPNATPVVLHRSDSLADIVWYTNKSSNNMFAKQLFLSIGAKSSSGPGNIQRANSVIGEWLAAKGLRFPELVMENGSGLSRIERISPKNLGVLLEKAAYSLVFDSYLKSLPVVGVDGTMARRLRDRAVTGRAYIKTGTLRDVKGIAGYVQSLSKRDYVVIFLINHPKAATPDGVAAQDRLIEWVYFDGPASYPPI